jgi:hypothetical protein
VVVVFSIFLAAVPAGENRLRKMWLTAERATRAEALDLYAGALPRV